MSRDENTFKFVHLNKTCHTKCYYVCFILGVLTGGRVWICCKNAVYLLGVGDRLCATLWGCTSSEVCPITGSGAAAVQLSGQVNLPLKSSLC